jgi:hypothetical protein
MRTNVPAAWWPIPLRLIVGYGFMTHGIAKLLRGVGAFAAILHALGVPFAWAMAPATVAIELTGGAAILLGAWVRLAAVPPSLRIRRTRAAGCRSPGGSLVRSLLKTDDTALGRLPDRLEISCFRTGSP